MKSFILCIFHNTDLIIGEGWISAWHVLSFRFRANFFNNSMVLVVGSGGANGAMGSRSVPDQLCCASGWVCGPRSLKRRCEPPRKARGWLVSESQREVGHEWLYHGADRHGKRGNRLLETTQPTSGSEWSWPAWQRGTTLARGDYGCRVSPGLRDNPRFPMLRRAFHLTTPYLLITYISETSRGIT